MRQLKLGIVTVIVERGTGLKTMQVRCDDGSFECFFEEFKGWNKSLKEGDRVKVYSRYSNFMSSFISYKINKTKIA